MQPDVAAVCLATLYVPVCMVVVVAPRRQMIGRVSLLRFPI